VVEALAVFTVVEALSMGAGVSEASIRGAALTPSMAEVLTIFTAAHSVATTTVLITTMADITATRIMAAITGTPTTTADTMATPGMEDLVSVLVSARSGGFGAIPTAIDLIPRRTRITRMVLTAILPTLRMIGTLLPTLRIKIANLVTQPQPNLAGVTTVTRTHATQQRTTSRRQHHQT